MIVALETIGLCLLFTLFCFLGTGTEKKNLKSLRSYPKSLQEKVLADLDEKDRPKFPHPILVFLSNLLLFLIIIFLLGIAVRSKNYWDNLFNLLIIGEVFNLYDLLLDLLWWRNTKRIRFEKYPDKELYKSPKEHVNSFIKAFFMFLIIAVINAYLLTLF